MYDFKNRIMNEVLLSVGAFLGFMITALILPEIVSFILLIIFFWLSCGVASWSIQRAKGKIEEVDGVPFYKSEKFLEYLLMGPITFWQYF